MSTSRDVLVAAIDGANDAAKHLTAVGLCNTIRSTTPEIGISIWSFLKCVYSLLDRIDDWFWYAFFVLRSCALQSLLPI